MSKGLYKNIRNLISSLVNIVYISIRVKLALVSLTLLTIPFIGYQYIQEMEQYLRQDQESALLENARIVSAVLEDYPQIFATTSEQEVAAETTQNNSKPNSPAQSVVMASARDGSDSIDNIDSTDNIDKTDRPDYSRISPPPSQTNHAAPPAKPANKHHLFIRSLRSPVLLDGYAEDWIFYRDRVLHYKTDESTTADPIQYRFSIGTYQRYLYALFQVQDKNVIYRKANSNKVDANDHIKIALQDKKGKLRHFILSSYTRGNMSVHRVLKQKHGVQLKPETRIGAYWLETRSGYNVELRVPLSMIGNKLAFGIADVDHARQRDIVNILATTHQSNLTEMSTISMASPEVEILLSRLKRRFTRIWVVDQNANILALSGQLTDADENNEVGEEFVDISFSEALLGVVRLFYRMVLKQPAKEFQDDLSAVSHLSGHEIKAALSGNRATQWRLTPDSRVNILTATSPVIINEEIVGGIAIEQTSNSILLLQNRAVEVLINLSIVTLFLAMVTLLGFATRLSMRIRHLRNQTENAIGEDGRIQGEVTATKAADELGDLSRSFDDMLNRLTQYNRYLETMASKLSHEFRTPITVVKSSLDNLELGSLDKSSRAYTERAREGIERLNNILTRMSEATRLEQTLQSEHCEIFDLEKVVSGCVKGYGLAKPEQNYEFQIDKQEQEQALIKGAPDLIAQQLDKLVSNANSFALPDTPILINLSVKEKEIELSVANQGALLPEEMQHTLFESMVSIRDKKGEEPHLGLGLYIVRLIAEFHNAKLSGSNNSRGDGVVFTITFDRSSGTL